MPAMLRACALVHIITTQAPALTLVQEVQQGGATDGLATGLPQGPAQGGHQLHLHTGCQRSTVMPRYTTIRSCNGRNEPQPWHSRCYQEQHMLT
jgi:hypothetical protein